MRNSTGASSTNPLSLPERCTNALDHGQSSECGYPGITLLLKNITYEKYKSISKIKYIALELEFIRR